MSMNHKLPSEIDVVMYHYVYEKDDSDFSFLNGITSDMMKSQIEKMAKTHHFISALEYLEFIEGGTPLPKKSCMLSFDDGTIDHYKYVYPILKGMGLPGLMSIATSPLTQKEPLVVNLIHQIMGKFEPEDIVRIVNKIIQEKFPKAQQMVLEYADKGTIRAIYRFDNYQRASIKYQLNYVWDPLLVRELIYEFFSSQVESLESFCSRFYLSWEQVEEMEAGGMSIASHSHNHIAYSLLSEIDQEKDVAMAQSIINKKVKNKDSLRIFTYPYGNKSSFSEEIISVLKKAGYSAGFATFSGTNDPTTDPFMLKRSSTHMFPF